MITPLILLGVVAVVAIVYVSIYNSCVHGKQKVEEGWSGIDVQLKRRLDLVPNLINTVKGYAKHEAELLEKVTAERTKVLTAGSSSGITKERIDAENMLTQGLKSVFAIAENYPELKANTNFLELQRQLTETEDQISASRRIYNGNVTSYNTTITTFPGLFIAGVHGFVKAEFFQMDEAEKAKANVAPVVNF
jgi:LemA protein